MKNILMEGIKALLVFALFAPPVHADFLHSSVPYVVSTRSTFTCVRDDDGVKCWGNNSGNQTEVPDTLGNVTQLATGSNHACALDEQGVTCWGSTQWPVTEVPETLTNPTLIAAYDLTTCAVDEPEGEDAHIECWGSVAGPINSFMPKTISNVKSLSLGRNFICLLDDNGPNCWGYDYHGVTDIPKDLVSPVKLSAGYGHVCVLDETPQGNVVRCWGDGANGELDVPVDLNNPIDVVSGSFRSCALQSDGVRCWGQNHVGQSEDQILDQPYSLKLGYAHTCAMSASNLHCWGSLPSGRPSDLSFIDFDNDGTPNEEDAFLTNPAASLDEDGDGLADNCVDEACGGLTQDPSLDDTDNDGIKNSNDDVVGDNNPPVILTVPATIVVAASENQGSSQTIKLNVNELAGEDFVSSVLSWQMKVGDGELKAVEFYEDLSLTLPTGRHTLTWYAFDEAWNSSVGATQIIDVYPAVSFSVSDSEVKEGDSIAIELSLTGIAPSYPIEVQIGIDASQSTTDESDLDGNFWLADSGTIQIGESGKAQLIVKTVDNDDGVDKEFLKLNFRSAFIDLGDLQPLQLNSALRTQHTITITSVGESTDPDDDGRDAESNDGSDDNTSGSSGGGSSGGGSPTPLLVLMLAGLLYKRRHS